MTNSGVVTLEPGSSAERFCDGLAKRGHNIQNTTSYPGGYQAVKRDGKLLLGASESRKDGLALGVTGTPSR